MKLTILSIGLMALITLSGCVPQNTKSYSSSNIPTVTISGVTKKQIMDVLIENKLNKGWRLVTQNDYGFTIIKDIDNFAARAAYGSKFNRTPAARIHYNMVDTSDGVKVIVKSEMVTNPESQYEKSRDLTSTWSKDSQAELNRLKQYMEKK